MWRQILQRMGTAVHPALQRARIENKGCAGIVVGDTLGPGELVALIPFWACASPVVALHSPWGTQLSEALPADIVGSNGHAHIRLPRDGAITTAFLAMAMAERNNPLRAYLDSISWEHPSDAELAAHMTAGDAEKLGTIRNISESIVQQLHTVLRTLSGSISLAHTRRAFTMCETRCVDVPFSDAILGGPALVPFVDLLNHDTESDSLRIYLASAPDIQKEGYPSWCDDAFTAKTPFFVVVRAYTQVDARSELTYAYADPQESAELYNDAVFWAARFRFLPGRLRHQSEELTARE